MNWENKDKDPWGNQGDAPDFDELMKKFSSILGGKKSSSNGSGGSGKGSGAGKNVRSEKEYINLTKKFFKKVETRVTNQIFIPYTYFSMYLKKK